MRVSYVSIKGSEAGLCRARHCFTQTGQVWILALSSSKEGGSGQRSQGESRASSETKGICEEVRKDEGHLVIQFSVFLLPLFVAETLNSLFKLRFLGWLPSRRWSVVAPFLCKQMVCDQGLERMVNVRFRT